MKAYELWAIYPGTLGMYLVLTGTWKAGLLCLALGVGILIIGSIFEWVD